MLTYNQLVEKNREFATAHKIIKNFGNGERWKIVDHNQQSTFKYPLMWMEDQPHPATPGLYTTVFRVYMCGQVAQLKQRGTDLMSTNRNEVISDMVQCAQDLISYWVQDHDYPLLDIEKNFTATTFDDKLDDVVAGCYFDIKFKQAYDYNKCAIPMSGVTPPPAETCDPASVTVNSETYAEVASGGTLDIPVVDTAGTSVTVVVDAGVKITTPDVSYTDSDGSTKSVKYQAALVCTPAAPASFLGLVQTGQTTSFRTGDDGDSARGINNSVLTGNNPFGNTDRYTDTVGGQTYANDLVVDWLAYDPFASKVLVIFRTPQNGIWNSVIDAAVTATIDSKTGWRVINKNELSNILQSEGLPSNFLNYAPFNIVVSGTSTRIWTSSQGNVSANATAYTESGGIQSQPKGVGSNTLWVRYYSLAELGL